VLVANTVGVQATGLLEATCRMFGGSTKDARLGTSGGREPGGTEAAL